MSWLDVLTENYLGLVSLLISVGVVFAGYFFYLRLKEYNDLEALKRKERIESGRTEF
jgi:Tfp pilus assembly protein PilO